MIPMESVMIIAIYIALICVFGGLYVVAIADYVMSSIAIQRIASRSGVDKSWLIWIPIVREWVFGSLLDANDEKRGIQRNWKKIFLMLSILGSGIMMLAYITLMGTYMIMFATAAADAEEMMMVAIIPILLYYVLMIVGAIVVGALNACRMISIFKVFEETVPEKVVKYFIIYLMVPLGGSICLLKCKELGQLEPEQIEEIEV